MAATAQARRRPRTGPQEELRRNNMSAAPHPGAPRRPDRRAAADLGAGPQPQHDRRPDRAARRARAGRREPRGETSTAGPQVGAPLAGGLAVERRTTSSWWRSTGRPDRHGAGRRWAAHVLERRERPLTAAYPRRRLGGGSALRRLPRPAHHVGAADAAWASASRCPARCGPATAWSGSVPTWAGSTRPLARAVHRRDGAARRGGQRRQPRRDRRERARRGRGLRRRGVHQRQRRHRRRLPGRGPPADAGPHGYAGEIGHVPVAGNGPRAAAARSAAGRRRSARTGCCPRPAACSAAARRAWPR